MKKKNRLDRGLDSLFSDSFSEPETKAEESQDSAISEIRISLIEPNREQPRDIFDDEKLSELAESIRQFGIVQPILVRPIGNGSYQIIAGERRWRAARLAGLTEIPAYVRELDDVQTAQVSLIENIQREDLTPIEEAKAYRKLMDEYKMTQEQLAKAVGKSRSAIANSLRLLSLAPEIQGYVEKGMLSAGHAKVLAGLDEEQQLSLGLICASMGCSVRELEKMVQDEAKKQKPGKVSREHSVRKAVPFLKEFEASVKENSSVSASAKKLSDGRTSVSLTFPQDCDFEDALIKIAQILTDY